MSEELSFGELFEASSKTTLRNGEVREGTVIEVTVTAPGEEPVTSNLKVTESDIELFRSMRDLRS